MTGHVPFMQCPSHAVAIPITAGIRPKLPISAEATDSTSSIWRIVEDSWKQQPQERPTIRIVLDRVNQIAPDWIPLLCQ